MSPRAEAVEELLEALADAGPLRARPMFGEFGLYLDDRMVALICDGRLFVKPTPGARAALPDAPLAPPYPGAKDHILAESALDEPEPVVAALRAALAELPAPKPRKPRGRQA